MRRMKERAVVGERGRHSMYLSILEVAAVPERHAVKIRGWVVNLRCNTTAAGMMVHDGGGIETQNTHTHRHVFLRCRT